MAIRVALIEDTEDIRKLTASLLNFYADIECVGAFESAEDFEAALPGLRPDVALMDIGLPGKSGTEAIRDLKPRFPKVEFVVFTIRDEPVHLYEAFSVGATGYVLKADKPEKLAEAIRDVAAGGSPMNAKIARLVVDTFRRTEPKQPANEKLSEREKEVLDLLKTGMAYKEIAAALFVSMHTVQTHVRSIYHKLEVHTRTEALNKVFGK